MSALFAVALLVNVVYTVARRGRRINLDFITHNPAGLAGGGIANALIGTGPDRGIGALIALPIGILTGYT